MNQHSDFHQQGLFGVKNPSGEILLDTMATTAYSSRAEFVRGHNQPWSRAVAAGFVMAEFEQTGIVVAPRRTGPLLGARSTRQAWQLYDLPGADEAAALLGKALAEKLRAALNTGTRDVTTAKRIRDEMYALMDPFSALGTRDSGPETVLVEAIEEGLGLSARSLPR